MENNNPLVSIIIITYNSSEFVKDTLNSALSQTYSNIEIIVSDDCSTDDTIYVCEQWLADHHDSQIRVEIIKTEKNTGVSGNCNRGFRASKGEWLKYIAGDDMLAPTAIEDYVSYISKYPDTMHIRANVIRFKGYLKDSNLAKPDVVSPYLYRPQITVKKQYNVITKYFFGSGPTYFVNAEVLNMVGGFDERFPMQEDYPLYIKLIANGFKMDYMNKITVYYRLNSTSVSHEKVIGSIFTKNQVRMIEDYRYLYRTEVLVGIWKLFSYYSLWLQHTIVKNGNTKKSLKCRVLKILYSLTDPFVLYAHYINILEHFYLKKID